VQNPLVTVKKKKRNRSWRKCNPKSGLVKFRRTANNGIRDQKGPPNEGERKGKSYHHRCSQKMGRGQGGNREREPAAEKPVPLTAGPKKIGD